MKPYVEVTNEGNEDLYAVVCESDSSGNIYIHISTKPFDHYEGGQRGKKSDKVEPQYYKMVKVRKVKW